MRVMIVLNWSRSTLAKIGGKFARGADVEPENGEILARWHDLGAKKAWVVAELPDAPALQDWLGAWTALRRYDRRRCAQRAE